MDNPQAGWYADPSGDTTKLRYWDGTQWTDSFTNAQQPVGQGSNVDGSAYAQPENPYGNPAYAQPGSTPVYYPQAQVIDNGSDQALRLAAFVLCIICTVSVCWLIIPLAWMIPMTVHSWGIYKGTKNNTVGFGVCTLLFVSLIGGILLLVSKKDA